jgi:hypothetical protein
VSSNTPSCAMTHDKNSILCLQGPFSRHYERKAQHQRSGQAVPLPNSTIINSSAIRSISLLRRLSPAQSNRSPCVLPSCSWASCRYVAAQVTRGWHHERLLDMLSDECDVILTPATAETAPPVPSNLFTGIFVSFERTHSF